MIQLRENNLREACPQPVFNRCLRTHCVLEPAVADWRTFSITDLLWWIRIKLKMDGTRLCPWFIILVLSPRIKEPHSGRLEQRKKQRNVFDMNQLFEVNLESFFWVLKKKHLKERKNNNLVITHGKLSRIKNLIYWGCRATHSRDGMVSQQLNRDIISEMVSLLQRSFYPLLWL